MSTLTSLLDSPVSKIADFGREAADTLDSARRETAGGLHAAASSIRKGSKSIENFAETTAKTLDEAGSYVKKHDLKRAVGDSRQLVRRYPGESIAFAAGVGFLAGFAIRRMTHACVKTAA